jgi:hypothetical protein
MNGPFRDITPPYPTHIPPTGTGALIFFLNIGIKFVFVVAGLFALWKFIESGFSYINSNGDPQKIAVARDKITWTFVGLFVMFGSFAMASLIGSVFFGDPMAILNPTFTGVGTP